MAGIHTGRRGYPADFVGALFPYALWVTESRTMLPGGIHAGQHFIFGFWTGHCESGGCCLCCGFRRYGTAAWGDSSNQYLLGYPARHQCFPLSLPTSSYSPKRVHKPLCVLSNCPTAVPSGISLILYTALFSP